MAQPYKITGLQGWWTLDKYRLISRLMSEPLGVYPRREIRDLAEDEIQFTLFIHALQAIKQPDYRPKPARFQDLGMTSVVRDGVAIDLRDQLGGIHGLPYERWR